MTISTLSVAAVSTPTFFKNAFAYFLRVKSRKSPKCQFSYAEGLALIREFILYAEKHSIEDLQAFTSQHVPVPTWVHTNVVDIPEPFCAQSAEILNREFEEDGTDEIIGGTRWWTVRGRPLSGEWIEMMKHKNKREKGLATHERVVFYIHGGAYFFSSNDTHRYQITRHARKLGGRAFSPNYRLAPQYPFPCGLQDCLAGYLFLLNPPEGASHKPVDPNNIIIAGDSAGGGMALALMVLLRQHKLPMPAGSVLLSPWVDVAHSFPSIIKDARKDYIPSEGFHFKPSLGWPPIKGDGITLNIDGEDVELDEQIQIYCQNNMITHPLVTLLNQGSLGGLPPTMILAGSGELLRDEIIYLAHKMANPTKYLPSPVTLEQYPKQVELIDQYPPTKVHLQVYDDCAHVTTTLAFASPAKYQFRAAANFSLWALKAAEKRAARHSRISSRKPKKKSTVNSLDSEINVQLNGADSTVPSTNASEQNLPNGSGRQSTMDSQQSEASQSSTAVTGAGPKITNADGREANKQGLNGLAYDQDSEMDTNSQSSDEDENGVIDPKVKDVNVVTVTGVEPAFVDNMIRERVTIRGKIRAMEPIEELDAMKLPREHIGRIFEDGPIKIWLKKRAAWDHKFSKVGAAFREQKLADYAKAEKAGFLTRDLHGERPPKCAMVSWYDAKAAKKTCKAQDITSKATAAMTLWAKMAARPDEEQAEKSEVREAEKKNLHKEASTTA